MMNKGNMKMININTKKHLVMMNFPKMLDLPAILIPAMLHLMLLMEHQLKLELKVTIQPQEVLKKSMVLLVSMRGAWVAFPLLLWKEDKELDQKLQQLLMEMMVPKTPKCVPEGPSIFVCLCARVSLPGCTGPVCRAVRTGAGSEEQKLQHFQQLPPSIMFPR